MSAPRSPAPLQRGLSWLLWLALLLPMAQSAATCHAYSHLVPGAVGHEQDKQAPAAAHCAICLAASVLSDGAAPAAQHPLLLQAVRHALPSAAAGGVWLALPALAYLSRAPPAPR